MDFSFSYADLFLEYLFHLGQCGNVGHRFCRFYSIFYIYFVKSTNLNSTQIYKYSIKNLCIYNLQIILSTIYNLQQNIHQHPRFGFITISGLDNIAIQGTEFGSTVAEEK